MDALLLAGYGAVFVALFGYLLYIRRRLHRLDRRLQDLE